MSKHAFKLRFKFKARVQGKEQEIEVRQTLTKSCNPWSCKKPKTTRELLTHDNGFHDSMQGKGRKHGKKPLGSSNFSQKCLSKALPRAPQ